MKNKWIIPLLLVVAIASVALAIIDPELIKADVLYYPETFNLKSDQYLMAYIVLPQEYSVKDIDVKSMKMSGSIDPQLNKGFGKYISSELNPAIGDYDIDGVPDMLVKFDGYALIKMIGAEKVIDQELYLTTTGLLVDGKTQFTGTSIIRVINR